MSFVFRLARGVMVFLTGGIHLGRSLFSGLAVSACEVRLALLEDRLSLSQNGVVQVMAGLGPP